MRIMMTTKMKTYSTLPKAGLYAVMLLLAGGCTLAPKYDRPDSPVAGTWPEMGVNVAPQEVDGIVASELRWQEFYGDERLKALIALSLENNRDMRIAALNAEKARAMYQIQRSELLPSVYASGDLTRTTTGAGGRTPAEYSETARTMGPGSRVYTASVGVVSYELDLFGRVRSLNQAALANYFATVEAQKTSQISLVSAVAAGYYVLLADNELVRLTEETLQTRLESLKLTQLKFEHGVSSELDVRQAETLVESARSSLAQLKRQYAEDQNTFEVLIGSAIPEDLPAGASFYTQNELMPELSSGIPSEVLIRRPDIIAAEQQLIAANANIGAARAAFFPQISLTGTLGKASDELSDLFSSGHFWRFTPSISLPIFTGGRNVANLEVAEAEQKIAVAQYEKSIQTAFQEVSNALAGRATYGEQLDAMTALVAASKRAYELSDLQYRNGIASYMDLLDAQRTLYDAQQQQILARLSMLNNQVTLYKVLAGGWSAEDEEKIIMSMQPASSEEASDTQL